MVGRRWRAVAPLALTLILNTNTADAKWTVSPEIGLRELYSDNPTLATTDRRSDLITQITPAIRVDGSGARFKASLNYAPSAIFYAHHSSEDRVANSLQASGTLEAAEKFFFVDVNGAISQGFISPLGAQPVDVTTISSNRVESRTYGISPYVRGQAGRAFSYELRNRNTWTNTNSNALANVHATQWAGRATSPVSLFGWGLEYDKNEISYTSLDRPDYSSKLFRGRLYFQPDVDLRLSASAGREENNYTQQQQSYYIRGVGALWKPGPRTTAELEYEHRYFGAYRLARLEHRTRLSTWTLAYSRNGSNYQQELLRLPAGDTAALLDAIFAARIPDPAERQAAVEQFMRSSGTPAFLSNPLAFYTQQIFLHERLEASVGIVGKRNSVVFTGFRSETTALSSGAASVVSDAFSTGSRFTQRGFGVNATHQLTAFTTLGAGARRTLARQEEPATGDTRNDYLTLSLTQTLSPKTTTFAGLSYTRFDSSPAASAYSNARSAFVGLNHRF